MDSPKSSKEGIAFPRPPCSLDLCWPTGELNELVILWTTHESEKSMQEVVKAIEEIRPDIIALELCPARFRSLINQEETEEVKIHELLSGGKLYPLLIQMLLAYDRKIIDEKICTRPDSKMLAVIETARKTGTRVALMDGDVGITLQRFWSAMSLPDKARLMGSLISIALDWREDGINKDCTTPNDVISQIIYELRKSSPADANVLEDEHNAYIADNLYNLSRDGKVLAVVGAGHKEGIKRYLAHPEGIPARREPSKIPARRIAVAKVLGAAVTMLILAIIGLILINAQSNQNLLLAFGIWFTVTGGLSALGVILARGHPLSALTALMVAWLTTLIPFIAAGLFAGTVEAWKLKPTVTDLRRLGQASSLDQIMENKLFKVILVIIMANLGGIIGMLLGIYIIWQRLGLMNPAEFLKGIL